jgi:hypothetical protein
MKPDQRIRGAAAALMTIGAVTIGAVLLSSCSTPPAPPPAVAPPPPPAPAPPPVSLSDGLIQDAAVYQTYMTRVTAITPDFKNGDDVAQSLRLGESYDPRQLLRGSIAYAAIVALQDPTFVGEVRAFAASPVSRPILTNDLVSDPNYIVGVKGADSAAGLVIAAMIDKGQKLYSSGDAIKQSAYSIQHQSWSHQFVVNREQRLTDAKSASTLALTSTIQEAARLQQAAVGAAPLALAPAPAATQPYPQVVVRGLALAALAVLGEAGDDEATRIAPMVSEPAAANCLGMAKLNLYQCLAVSKPHYEDIFCLGQHVMMDTGQCMMIAAGAPPPVGKLAVQSTTEVAYAVGPASNEKQRARK